MNTLGGVVWLVAWILICVLAVAVFWLSQDTVGSPDHNLLNPFGKIVGVVLALIALIACPFWYGD